MALATEAIKLLLALVGIALTAERLWTRYRESRDHYFSWQRVDRGISELLRLMRRDSFRPATIIGSGRGGLVLAGLLVDRLGHPRVKAFAVDRETKIVQGSKVVRVRTDLADFVEAPKGPVLIVAGLSISGRTFDAYKNWLGAKGVTDVRTAVLVEGGGSGHQARYHFTTLGLDKHQVTFPWNKVLGQAPVDVEEPAGSGLPT